MIGTLDAVAVEHLAHAQRGEAVRAAVVQCDDLAIALAIEHHRLVQERAAEHLAVGEFVRPRRDIPGVVEISAADELLLALKKLRIMADLNVHRAFSASGVRAAIMVDYRAPLELGSS